MRPPARPHALTRLAAVAIALAAIALPPHGLDAPPLALAIGCIAFLLADRWTPRPAFVTRTAPPRDAANDNAPLPRGRHAPSPLAAAIARHYQMQRDRADIA